MDNERLANFISGPADRVRGMSDFDRLQIEQAARGCIDKTIEHWEATHRALLRLGICLPGDTVATTVTQICRYIQFVWDHVQKQDEQAIQTDEQEKLEESSQAMLDHVSKRAERFGLLVGTCETCQHLSGDGEEEPTYCEVKRVEVSNDAVCPLWMPDFWFTKFADAIIGEGSEQLESSIMSAVEKYRAVVKLETKEE